jgi:integrase
MQTQITDTWLRALRPPKSGGRLVIHDTKVPLLILRMTSAGTATWSVSVRTKDGKRTQPTLGRWPSMGIASARKRALAVLSEIHAGGDPVAERRAARADREARAGLRTVAATLTDWQAAKASQWSDRYQSEVRRLCNREIAPKLGKRALAETTRADWTSLITAVHRRSPSVGAMLYRTASAFLNHAEALGWISLPLLPRKGVAAVAPSTAPRERILTDDELRSIWDATAQLNPKPRAFAHLLVLTGCREMEAADIAVGEVDLSAGLWSIPGSRTKNGRGIVLPLCQVLIDDLRAVWPAHDAAPTWKLLSAVAGSGLRGFSPVKRRVDALSGTTRWRWHDLRRTCRSGLSALGVPLDIAERCLNHVSHASQLVRTYDRHSYGNEIIRALGRWQSHVMAVVSAARLGADVVTLRRAGR